MLNSSDARSGRTLIQRLRQERGAVLVEAAICIPLLLFVIFGLAEAGFAWEAKSATISGVRTGVLRAATEGDRAGVDLRILQSVIGEVGAEKVSQIDGVIIFEITTDADTDFDTCLASIPAGGFAGCVVYDNANVTSVLNGTVSAANFDSGSGFQYDGNGDVVGYTCEAGKLDSTWCASERTVGGDVQLGVGIMYTHDWMTGILPFDSPQFAEYVASSTFTNNGANPLPAPLAFATNNILPGLSFDSNPNGMTHPNIASINVPWASDSVGYATGGHGVGSTTATIVLEDLTPGNQVCVSLTLYAFGYLESADDTFTVDVGGQSQQFAYDGWGTTTIATTRTASDRAHQENVNMCSIVDSSGTMTISVVGVTDQGWEGWGMDDLVITESAP